MRQIRTAAAAMIALTVSVCSGSAVARQAPTAEVMSLGLRGVYFVENQGQWSDASVEYGFKTRGLDIAFRESSFTMHLSREVSRNVPVEVAVDPTDGAWASRPYEYQVVERASRPYESATVPEASLKHERGFFSFDDSHPLPHGRGSSGKSVEFEHLTLTVTFPGSNPATPRGAQPQAAKFNYYIGDDESRWASNVPSFGAIIYENLYDGVDLTIAGNDDGVLKYEFHVAPGADWNQIRIAYDGIDSLCVDESGDLRIATSFGTLMDSAPLVWQEDVESRLSGGTAVTGGTAVPAVHLDGGWAADDGRDARATSDTIPARFELVDDATYRFALDDPVDPTRELIIDPDVEWMVYLGGSGSEDADGLAIAPNGDVLVSGTTSSFDFEHRIGPHYGPDDTFILRMLPTGEVLWMSYVGGELDDYGQALAVDSAGRALVVGFTWSRTFARAINTYRGGSWDGFLAVVSPGGQIEWSAFVGGSASDSANAVAVDQRDRIWIAGSTGSPNLESRLNEHHGGDTDAFVSVLSPSGQTDWSIYLGGSASETVRAITLDSQSGAVLTGSTGSVDFEHRVNSYFGGITDGFLTSVSSQGVAGSMSYLGGSGRDAGSGVALPPAGGVRIGGWTDSPDFTGHVNEFGGGRNDAFLTSIESGGELAWTIYLGGGGDDWSNGIATDCRGRTIVAGGADSWNFRGRWNNRLGGAWDGFVAIVGPDARQEWMKFIGGKNQDDAKRPILAADEVIYTVGVTSSPAFRGRVNEFHGGSYDAFLTRLGPEPMVSATTSCPSGGAATIQWSRARPEGRVVLLYAREQALLRIPDGIYCAGTLLMLGTDHLQLVFAGTSDPNGSGSLNINAGPGACGGYLQLLDLSTCATSNVARIE